MSPYQPTTPERSQMSFEAAKAKQAELYQITDKASAALNEFAKYGSGPMGLTPDHVKAMPEWIKAKRDFDLAFAQLRAFNGWFNKMYKKEIKAERRAKIQKI
jgi:hypothetical protein